MDINYYDNIELAIRESRQQLENIEKLREEIRNETRPLVIEEKQERLERLIREHEEYDEITRNAYFRYRERLNDLITKSTLNSKNLTDTQKRMQASYIERMRKLIDIKNRNSDIIYDDGARVTSPAGTENDSLTESKIEDFKKDFDKITKQINDVKASLILDDTFASSLSDEIKELDLEVEELDHTANEIIAEIDSFRNEFGSENFSMSPKEIKAELKGIKDRLKDLKISQINKYNARVDNVNERIDALKSRSDLSPELQTIINNLNKLNRCNTTIKSWNQSNYLKELDYNKLKEALASLSEVETKIGVKPKNPDITHIEDEIKNMENITDMDELKEKIKEVSESLNELKIKLANDKDKMSEETYNEYLDRINDAEANLAELNKKIPKDNNIYKAFLDDLNKLEGEIKQNIVFIDALTGKITPEGLKLFEENLTKAANNLKAIKDDIEKQHNEGKLDDTQYNNLIAKAKELAEALIKTNEKMKKPEMVNETGVFAFLNNKIDGIEKAIENLKTQVDGLSKPIKDKNIRKQIDAIIKKLEEEIASVNKELENNKEENTEKYNEQKARIDSAEKKLNEISKNYRSKTPLLVKSKKSAKEFYKKHPKTTLAIAGLATIALIHATIGPIIIPAIMQGNIMLGRKIPGLYGFLDKTNKALGKAINAKEVMIGNNYYWQSAIGAIINPSYAASSLLKGLAISGLGSAALVSPLVIGIKELINKMKQSELKEKLKENINKVKENRKKKKETLKELKELYQKYKESGLSYDEFCEANGIDDENKAKLVEYGNKKGGR